jgi:uncharacterized Zn-finger protein
MSYPKKSMLTETIIINQADLPFACPPIDQDLFSAHPRVYLTFSGKDAVCPFCGSHYQLLNEKKS